MSSRPGPEVTGLQKVVIGHELLCHRGIDRNHSGYSAVRADLLVSEPRVADGLANGDHQADQQHDQEDPSHASAAHQAAAAGRHVFRLPTCVAEQKADGHQHRGANGHADGWVLLLRRHLVGIADVATPGAEGFLVAHAHSEGDLGTL